MGSTGGEEKGSGKGSLEGKGVRRKKRFEGMGVKLSGEGRGRKECKKGGSRERELCKERMA